jgi:hypothetical protein
VDRLEVELDKLAEVSYLDLPTAADYLDKAELAVARCDGLNNRRIFDTVDNAFADVRDLAIRVSLRRMQQSLLNTAEALRVVHSRYGGADESGSLAILQAGQRQRDLIVEKIDGRRDQQERFEGTHGVDVETAEELRDQAIENYTPEPPAPWWEEQ